MRLLPATCGDLSLPTLKSDYKESHEWLDKYMNMNYQYLWVSVPILRMHWNRLFAYSWWRQQMETFSALLALCEGNPPVNGGFPSQGPETRSFGIFFHLRLNKRLSKQSRRWLLRRHRAHYDVTVMCYCIWTMGVAGAGVWKGHSLVWKSAFNKNMHAKA